MDSSFQNSELTDLLLRNSVSVEQFYRESYSSLIVSLFEVLVEEMKDNAKRQKIKKRLLDSKNPILTVKNAVLDETNCVLNETEAQTIYDYLLAFFRKSEKDRKVYSSQVRIEKIQAQNYRCAICQRTISIDNSELDHIIPWAMVGDELGTDNLQLLCRNCNRRKSKSVLYNLKMFLINKE